MRVFHKVGFTVGYQGDAEVLDFGFFQASVGVGYQVVDDETGAEVGLFSLDGQRLTLPKVYSFEFLQTEVPAPVWGADV